MGSPRTGIAHVPPLHARRKRSTKAPAVNAGGWPTLQQANRTRERLTCASGGGFTRCVPPYHHLSRRRSGGWASGGWGGGRSRLACRRSRRELAAITLHGSGGFKNCGWSIELFLASPFLTHPARGRNSTTPSRRARLGRLCMLRDFKPLPTFISNGSQVVGGTHERFPKVRSSRRVNKAHATPPRTFGQESAS